MSTQEIIALLKQLNVVPVAEGEQLKLTGDTGSLSQELIATIQDGRQELLSFLRENANRMKYASIERVGMNTYYEVSDAQKRIWLLCQREGGNTAYNIVTGLYLKGTINPGLMDQALKIVVAKHESLHTVFREVDFVPRQFIVDEMEPGVKVELFQGTPLTKEYILEKYQMLFKTAFDLENGPLLRMDLLQVEPLEAALFLTIHHIISDGWSVALLLQEILYYYSRLSRGETPVVEPMTIQYRDYVAWLSQRTNGTLNGRAAQFWEKEYTEPVSPLNLPADFPRPGVKNFEGGVCRFYWQPDMYNRIRRFCKEQQVTVFNFFRTTLSILLNKLSGQQDIIIGTPVSVRDHYELEEQLGLYVNTLPLRSFIHDTEPFLDCLKRTSLNSKQAFEFQEYALDKIIEHAAVRPTAGRDALFDVLMVVQNNPSIRPDAASELMVENIGHHLSASGRFDLDNVTAKFDLSFNFSGDTDNRFSLEIEYATGLYRKDTIVRLYNAYRHLISQVLDNPGETIKNIQAVSPEERDQLLYSFNDTAVAYAREKTVADLFTVQAALTPDKTALIAGANRLTYDRLNKLANQVARYLTAHYNISADDLIGVQLERSEWQVICLLGILKAGGAYVPIDPDYPQDRIDYMLADSRCKAVVDAAALKQLQEVLSSYDDTDLPPVAGSNDLIYVMYTSGSTGRPKGCMLEHRNIVSRLCWMWGRYGFNSNDIILQKTSFTFDVSILELFLPLCFGASTVLCAKEDAGSPERLLSLIQSENITCVHFVPSMLNSFLGYGFESDALRHGMRSVTKAMASGEALAAGTVERWFAQLNIPLHNLYGPTESAIEASACTVQRGDQLIPIGRPIWNTQLYILGAGDQPVPIGVTGEICIGGDGLARGYLNNATLTAEKFVPNPFRNGERIYRTGDTGYWQADGTVVYTGRKDDQVKVRGFRIEPAEIENALQEYKNISDAVVMARTGNDGGQEIVAYVVSNLALDITDLKRFLAKRLPAYMLPAWYMKLDALPLNASGKTDKRSLPAPDGLALAGGAAYIAPRNNVEAKLVSIWSTVLGINENKISVTDSFFSLGGHSLKATRLASLIYRHFDVKFILKELFTYDTLEQQAKLIQESAKAAFTSILPVAAETSYALSAAQRRLWVLSQLESGNVAYNIHGACLFVGALDRSALELAFNSLISRHEILRTVFREDEQGEVRQYIHSEVAFRIEYADLRGNEEELPLLLTREGNHLFDLSTGPLLRVALYQLADDKSILSLLMHHIISDGWSMGVLIKELQHLYNGDAALSPLRIQYKDYAHWQQQQLSGKILEEHRAYWLQQFAGELPVLELPADKARPAVKSFAGGKKSRLLNTALSTGLKQLVKQQDATLFMGLLAAVNTLLFRYTGQTDIITGTPVAGREHIDLEEQIGFYVNTLALRSRFTGSDSFETFLASIREHTLQAYAHQAYPFDVLVDELNLSRDLSRHPLFDVMVVLHNETADYAAIWNSAAGSSKMEAYNEELPVSSRFDWQFDFTETGDSINVELTYNSDIYNESRITGLLVHLENLLASIVSAPATALDQLQYLTAEEQQQLIYSFNDTAIAYGREKTVIELFTEQAALAPAKTALVYGDARFTYRMLHHLSNRVGHYLREQYNIGADDLVAVQLERSEWQVICLLGVLKAGGAYVPIDPTYPQERIDYILADSNCKAVLDAGALQQLKELILNYDDTDLSPVAASNNLMYVIYTSGSTGRPKGCMLEHRGVVNRLNWMWHHYGFNSDDIILQKTSFTFDVSVWELFLPLCFGASEVLCPTGEVGSPEKLLSLISSEHITCLHFVPSMLNSFLSYGFEVDALRSGMSSVTKVMASGEALTAATVERWYEQLQIPLHNLYGPTEASIDVTAYSTSRGDQLIPIGRPLWNTQLYVLGAGSQLSPIGVQGEICIGGDGLARGYLNNAALTAERFVPHPFSEGGKIYLTGDLGYWQPDGTIVYTGRKDHQVKIRGYRVEIGEIEHVLQQYSDINNAVVVARTDSDGEKELIAYVVSDSALDIAKLKNCLANTLPRYMIPARYVQLDAMPLNASGKTDRKSLPAPEGFETTPGVNYVAPRNEVEQQLVQLWSEVLGISKEKIGVKDNFFDLGAHSLKAVKLISRINATFLVRINIQNIFMEPTIENLCLQIEFFLNQNRQEKNKSELVQIDI